jgi:hypothetical protein
MKFLWCLSFIFLVTACGKQENKKVIVLTQETQVTEDNPSTPYTPLELAPGATADMIIMPEDMPGVAHSLAPSSCNDWKTEISLPTAFKNIPCSGTKLRYCLGGIIVGQNPGVEARTLLFANQHGSKVVVGLSLNNNFRNVMVEICTASGNELSSNAYEFEFDGLNPSLPSHLSVSGVNMPGYTESKTLVQSFYLHSQY